MKFLRCFPVFLLASLLIACATTGGAKFPGRSLASSRLQNDTMETIKVMESLGGKSCTQRKVIGTEVIERGIDPKYDGDRLVEGKWTERWTVDRCGKVVRYRVMYSINQMGGQVINLSPPEDDKGNK